MPDISPDMLAAIKAQITEQLADFGSFYASPIPSTPALATPTGFGLVETEFSEGAPRAANAANFVRGIVNADVAVNNLTFASIGVPVPVLAGQSWLLRAALYINSAAGATGGVQFRCDCPAVTRAGVGVMGGRSGNSFLSSVQAPTVASTTLCNLDLSASIQMVLLEASFTNLLAAGQLDVQFKNAVGAETYRVIASSWVQATRVA